MLHGVNFIGKIELGTGRVNAGMIFYIEAAGEGNI